MKTYRRPQGLGIRVDDGFEEGMSIPFYYDPMIAKMICHADTREAAIEKTIRAIDEYQITGVETTLGFCKFVMQHEAFRSGRFDTKFIENYFKPALLNKEIPDLEKDMIASLLASKVYHETSLDGPAEQLQLDSGVSKWKAHRT